MTPWLALVVAAIVLAGVGFALLRHHGAVETFTPSGDWCSVCFEDLAEGEVWEVRQHLANEAEMGGEGGSWLAQTYCAEHAPAEAIRV